MEVCFQTKILYSSLRIQCERDEKDVIYPNQVERDAVDLFEVSGEINNVVSYRL